MKKIILAATCFLFLGTVVKGQVFEKGKNYLSVGIGAGNFSQTFLRSLVVDANNNNSTNVKFASTGPLFFKFENAVENKVGFGVNVAYMSNAISYTETNTDSSPYAYDAKLKCTTFSILARVNYHLGNSEKIDPYIGIGVGYRNVNWTYTDTDKNSNNNATNAGFDAFPKFPLGADLTFGLRYLFTTNIGLYTEVGMSKGVIQGGLQFKF